MLNWTTPPTIRRTSLCGERCYGVAERHRRLVGRSEPPDGYGALDALPLADDQQDGNFGVRMLPHFIGDLLIAQIALDAQAFLARRRDHVERVFVGLLGDRRDDDLQGRKPERQMTGEVLDQNAGEALQRAEHGAMNHDRGLLFAIGIDIEGAEASWKIEVYLRRAALPFAPNRVAQRIFEFRTVERALAGIDRGFIASSAQDFKHAEKRGLRLVPGLTGADALFGPRR